MARAIGLGLSTGKFLVKSPALWSPTPVKKPTPAWFCVKSTGAVSGGGVSASTTEKKARGIMLPQPISPALEEFLGVPEVSRAQAIKLIWQYIKANNLQDPSNKKIIVCDEKLHKVFGKDRVGMLEVSGLISPHLLKA